MQLSKEYEEFLQEFKYLRKNNYEKVCSFSEKIFPIPVPSGLSKKYQQAINFANMNTTPQGAFSLALLSLIIIPLLLFPLAFFFHVLTIPLAILILFLTVALFLFLYTHPFTVATSYRIKASSEMVLAVVYFSITMKMIPNIEEAVKFAASNLTGSLAKDLKKVLWDVYTGRFVSVSAALDEFINKWKRDSEEFTEAIYLIKTAYFESSADRDKVLNEAISLVLSGTKERMKNYSQDLRSPLTVLNALGILLPIVGLVFFPIMSIFLPEAIQPAFLVIGYNIILPVTVYWLMKNYLEKRPAALHQPDVDRHPKFLNDTIGKAAMLLGILVPIPLIVLSSYQIFQSTEIFSVPILFYSLVITWSIAGGIIIYTIMSTYSKLKIREEVVAVESEMGEVLFQIGSQLTRGMPIENAMKSALPKIKELKIRGFVEKIVYNMETFGMTFSSAVFDQQAGAINYYPSRLIRAVMKAVTEISKSGSVVLSNAMISISLYLKNMHTVEEDMKEMLSEVTSSMEMQALLLAPLSSGIVVAMAGIVMELLLVLKDAIGNIYDKFGSLGPLGSAGSGVFTSILKINQIIPVYIFQLIVGIYLIEVLALIAIFKSIIKDGDDNLLRKYGLGKMLLLGTVIYSGVLMLIYFSFKSLIPAAGLLGI